MLDWLFKSKKKKPSTTKVRCEFKAHFTDGMECHGTHKMDVSRSAEFELAQAIRRSISDADLGMTVSAIKVYNIENA